MDKKTCILIGLEVQKEMIKRDLSKTRCASTFNISKETVNKILQGDIKNISLGKMMDICSFFDIHLFIQLDTKEKEKTLHEILYEPLNLPDPTSYPEQRFRETKDFDMGKNCGVSNKLLKGR